MRRLEHNADYSTSTRLNLGKLQCRYSLLPQTKSSNSNWARSSRAGTLDLWLMLKKKLAGTAVDFGYVCYWLSV